MTSTVSEGLEPAQPSPAQANISHNVLILMAYKRIHQIEIAKIIGKHPSTTNHKLHGRAEWSVDELVALSKFGGRGWPVSRFLEDPSRDPELGDTTDA